MVPPRKSMVYPSERKRILELSQEERGRLGIGEGTLHNLTKNALRERHFKIYEKVRNRLQISEE